MYNGLLRSYSANERHDCLIVHDFPNMTPAKATEAQTNSYSSGRAKVLIRYGSAHVRPIRIPNIGLAAVKNEHLQSG